MCLSQGRGESDAGTGHLYAGGMLLRKRCRNRKGDAAGSAASATSTANGGDDRLFAVGIRVEGDRLTNGKACRVGNGDVRCPRLDGGAYGAAAPRPYRSNYRRFTLFARIDHN